VVVVLAAGQGRRMGGPKALMTVGGQAWWRVQDKRLSELPRVWVASRDVANQMRDCPVPILAGDPDAPMFDSIRVGLDCMKDPEVGGVFILPVDVPAPPLKTFQMLAAAAGNGAAIPTYEGRRGHPAALSRPWIERVLMPAIDAGGEQRLDHLLGADAVEIPVPDHDVAVNLNTPEEVRRWQEECSRRGAESAE